MPKTIARGTVVSKAEQIDELEGKIVAVCVQCPHAKWASGGNAFKEVTSEESI